MRSRVLVVLALALLPGSVWAARRPSKEKPVAPAAAEPPAGEEDQGPPVKHRKGPEKVSLGQDLSIDLPAGFILLEKAEANAMMQKMGNFGTDDSLLALVAHPPAGWMVVVRFEPEGYVKDDEAEKLDAGEILSTIREATEAANEERQKHGFAPIHVDGWTESPHYDRQAHHLVWGIKGSSKNGASVNYNTRVLGRKGYASLNLIDDPDGIEAGKPDLAALLAATTFAPGARYADFDAKTDKVAEYGLAALVAGGAGAAALKLAKVGLLAKFGGKLLALIIALKKGIVLILLAIGAFLKRILARLRNKPAAPPPAEPPPPAAPPPADPT
jgi:uncharacterized membrane-anchored protein